MFVHEESTQIIRSVYVGSLSVEERLTGMKIAHSDPAMIQRKNCNVIMLLLVIAENAGTGNWWECFFLFTIRHSCANNLHFHRTLSGNNNVKKEKEVTRRHREPLFAKMSELGDLESFSHLQKIRVQKFAESRSVIA